MTMRILHLSDLHFGTEAKNIVQHLLEAINSLAPKLIIISGDFTQIANHAEFEKARDFIKNLNVPVFCVPGNHDISRYNFLERLLNPYKKYKKFIHSNLLPIENSNECIILGLNTARRILPHWNWANGAISKKQLQIMEQTFANALDKYTICVMHHPIHKAEKAPLKVTVFGAKHAMQKIHDLKVDLVLTGHVHYASITTVQNTIFSSATTAISSRLRSQANGFNVIDLHADFFEICHYEYAENCFKNVSIHKHSKNHKN